MNHVKYFLFSLLCMICSCVVFAKDEITIEKMIPVYDENSGVIVSEENGVHSVIFNDKDQNVQYNIVLKNNTNNDIKLDQIILPKSPEDFFKYELEGLDKDVVLKANSTKDVVLSLETIKVEGWGRNFIFDLTNKIEMNNVSVINPNTSAQELIVLFVSITFITGIVTICLKNKKVSRYVVLVVMFGSIISVTNAKDLIILPIKLNVSYESQNVMMPSGCSYNEDYNETISCNYFWEYNWQISNFYIENEFNEIENYAYKFDVSEFQNEKVVAYLVENEEESSCYDLHLQADGIIYANKDASFYFADFYNIEEIENIQGFDTSLVTDMSYMFFYTGRSNPEFILDISNFDTSNVTDMNHMFYATGCDSENFTLDLSNFDTSKVTDMSYMFVETGHSSINFVLDLSNFDTSNVTDMRGMFSSTGHNSTVFTLDLSNFDTSNVTDMSFMFSSTGGNNTNFTLDLSNFDTSNVTDMSGMFGGTGYNSTVFTLDVSNFDTSNVTDMSGMFSGTGHSNSNFTLDVSNFDTSNVTDMSSMFHSTGDSNSNFTLDVSNFDTSKVTNMKWMFCKTGYSSENFTLDVSNFDTSKVTDMSYMFNNAGYNSTVFTLALSNFDTSNVTDMSSMFSNTGYNSTKLNTSITIKNPNITRYSNMFSYVATKSGSKITVNYTSETSSLVDQLIATKSSNSNVVKGVQVD